MPAKKKAASEPEESGSKRRQYLKQTDVPAATLEEALRIPQAIVDHYAGKPTAPFHVAKALNIDPKGSQFRVLSGAAIAFGLTEGGAQSAAISVTDLGRKILRPKEEGADLAGRREAVMRPRVFSDFLSRYDGNAFPRQDIAENVLEDMGVPRDKTAEVLERITASARSVGYLEDVRDKLYVVVEHAQAGASAAGGTVRSPDPIAPQAAPDVEEVAEVSQASGRRETAGIRAPADTTSSASTSPARPSELASAIISDVRRRRVFITHGKSRDLVDPIKKLLEFGELEPVVSVERQSVSKPVPEKVMDDMRECGAAIIHVDADRTVTDAEGTEHVLLNPNVLIEIGAAMAFYGRRFILLVREGVKLPSNLQGLYEVRYSGQTLDATATIKLLEAIKDIKNYALPTDFEGDEG